MGIRLGIIVPSGNTLLETELPMLPLQDTSFHFTRVVNYLDTEEELAAMVDRAPEAAELLAHAQVHAIAFGCTGGSFLKGKGYDQQVIDRMASRVSVPCITTSSAALAALKQLRVRRLMLLTPYEEWLTERGKQFFRSNGFEVIGSKHLSITDPQVMVDMPSEDIAEWAKKQVNPDCDGVFISCTCFRGMGAAERLEHDLGVPVVTSNQATVWQLLRLTGYKQPVKGYGRLLHAI